MPVSDYQIFTVIADNAEAGDEGTRRFNVRAFAAPAGESQPARQSTSAELERKLRQLGSRSLQVDDIVDVGSKLADLLLPPGETRELFLNRLDGLGTGAGLRLRLYLDHSLSTIPWEYMYVQRGGGEKDLTGFLALNTQISIVRHEALPTSAQFDTTPRPRSLLVVLSNPKSADYAPLDLGKERQNIESAVQDIEGLTATFVENPSLDTLSDRLLTGTDIFHFAGHGTFVQTGLGDRRGTVTGKGALVLVNNPDERKPDPVAADELAVELSGHGTQLVVLDACQSAQRDEQNVWSGIAPVLMKVGIPGAVAMQYEILDENANAFSRSFYRSLAAGLPLDTALTEGRRAIFRLCNQRLNEPDGWKGWRDWGVPVLYLRATENFVLPMKAPAPPAEGMLPGPGALPAAGGDTPAPARATTGAKVDKRALRTVLVQRFNVSELGLLCADVEQDMQNNGTDVPVSLDIVGGEGLEMKALNLIEYLDRRGLLNYLINEVRKQFPGAI